MGKTGGRSPRRVSGRALRMPAPGTKQQLATGPAPHRPSLLGAGEVRGESEHDMGHALARFRLVGRRAEPHGRAVVPVLVQMAVQTVTGVVGHGGNERRAC